jgi:hypothetical protein
VAKPAAAVATITLVREPQGNLRAWAVSPSPQAEGLVVGVAILANRTKEKAPTPWFGEPGGPKRRSIFVPDKGQNGSKRAASPSRTSLSQLEPARFEPLLSYSLSRKGLVNRSVKGKMVSRRQDVLTGKAGVLIVRILPYWGWSTNLCLMRTVFPLDNTLSKIYI